MRLQLNTCSEEDDRTGDVCEIAGRNIISIPDQEVVRALLTLRRIKIARSMGASEEDLARIAYSYRPYKLESPPGGYAMYYDDCEYDCDCTVAKIYIAKDWRPSDEPFYVKLEFNVDFCELIYNDDDEATNIGEYDTIDPISFDITKALSKLGTKLVSKGLRGSSAIVFTVTQHDNTGNNDSEATET